MPKVHNIIYQSIYQTDCLDLMQGLPDGCADLVLTDIPYDVVNRPSGGLRCLDKGGADVLTFDLQEFLEEVFRIMKGHVLIFCGDIQFSEIISFFKAKKVPNRIYFYGKTHPSPMNGSRVFLSAGELGVYAKKPSTPFYGNCVENYWIGAPEKRGLVKASPCKTVKPHSLFEHIISTLTQPKDLVVDPCCGSGTTPAACKFLRRRCIAGDIDKDSVRFARKRTRATLVRLGR